MDPNSNNFVALDDDCLLPSGDPVPADWPTFTVGQHLTVRGYRWEVEECAGERLTLRAVGPLSKGQWLRNKAKRRRKARRR